MFSPWAKTNPAKLVATSCCVAADLIASRVFLDTRGALGAFFGVFEDPVCRPRFEVASLCPCLALLARQRKVGFLLAAKAELGATNAANIADNVCTRVGRNGFAAPLTRTPPNTTVNVDVGLRQKLSVRQELGRVAEAFKVILRAHLSAPCHRAVGKNTSGPFPNRAV